MRNFIKSLLGLHNGGMIKADSRPGIDKDSFPLMPRDHGLTYPTHTFGQLTAEKISADAREIVRKMIADTKPVDDDMLAGLAEMADELSADSQFTAMFLTSLSKRVHDGNVASGWWTDMTTGQDVRAWPKHILDMWISSKLMLIVTEIAEAMEGHRKNLNDDKLPHRPMIRVELADALIRILDMAGGFDEVQHPFGDVVQEKREYNDHRADHKIENRLKEGGKSI